MTQATTIDIRSPEFWSAERVRKFRDALGWSREKMAEMLGTHERSVHRWETGEVKRVTPRTARDLAVLAAGQLSEAELKTLAD